MRKTISKPQKRNKEILFHEPYNIATGDTYSIATGEPLEITTGEPYDIATGELYEMATCEPYERATGEPYGITTGELCDIPISEPYGIPTDENFTGEESNEGPFGLAYDVDELPKIAMVHTLDRQPDKSGKKSTVIEIFPGGVFQPGVVVTPKPKRKRYNTDAVRERSRRAEFEEQEEIWFDTHYEPMLQTRISQARGIKVNKGLNQTRNMNNSKNFSQTERISSDGGLKRTQNSNGSKGLNQTRGISSEKSLIQKRIMNKNKGLYQARGISNEKGLNQKGSIGNNKNSTLGLDIIGTRRRQNVTYKATYTYLEPVNDDHFGITSRLTDEPHKVSEVTHALLPSHEINRSKQSFADIEREEHLSNSRLLVNPVEKNSFENDVRHSLKKLHYLFKEHGDHNLRNEKSDKYVPRGSSNKGMDSFTMIDNVKTEEFDHGDINDSMRCNLQAASDFGSHLRSVVKIECETD